MRKIDHIIVHATATPEGREVSVAEIDEWHRLRGFRDPATGIHIGYHYVVHLDGSISEGRPASSQGAHARGHNAHSLGVAYVGGVAADDVTKPVDTRTPEQKRTLERLLRELVAEYPIRDISGHNEWSAKACPSFDASDEYDWLLETADGPMTLDIMIRLGEQDGPRPVSDWQEKLRTYGYDVPVTGAHEGISVEATRWFQREHDLVVDGIVGPQTMEMMDVALETLAEGIPR